MIFNTISNLKYKSEFKLVTYLIVLSIILSLSGCATTESLRVESESITYNMNYEIVEVRMKDGTVINLRGKSPRYFEEWENKKNILVYTNDTIWISKKSYKISDETKVIELDNVRWVILERDDKEVEVTVTTKKGIRHKGVLLSVTDNKITLSNKKAKKNVIEIEKDSVERILIHGDNNIFSGLGYGALIGFSTGALIGFGSNDGPFLPPKELVALIGGAVGAFVGGLIGLIVGITSSTPDKTIVIFSNDDYYKLMRYIKLPSYDSPIDENNK